MICNLQQNYTTENIIISHPDIFHIFKTVVFVKVNSIICTIHDQQDQQDEQDQGRELSVPPTKVKKLLQYFDGSQHSVSECWTARGILLF